MVPELLADPVPLAALTLAIAAAVHLQRGLTWTEYRELHRLKRRAFPVADRVWPHFVHEKGGRDDAEYLTTRSQSPKAVWKQLVAEGGSPHLVASVKRREIDGDVQYSVGHVVWMHGTEQTEAFLFANPDGTTDVYAHVETKTTDPEGHLTDGQTNGDARGVVADALGL